MFGPSVKSVPGWWVSIVPMLIGEPVALTPGFGPHDDVLTAAWAIARLFLALVLLLLSQPTRAATNAVAATARVILTGFPCRYVILSSSVVRVDMPDTPRARDGEIIDRRLPVCKQVPIVIHLRDFGPLRGGHSDLLHAGCP